MSPGPARRVELGEVVRHAVVAVLWLAAFGLLSDHAFRLIPPSWARSLSLQAYLTFVQVLTASVGVGLSLLLLPAPRASLGLSAAPLPRLAVLLLLSPLVYVLASYAAIWAALPTLLAELAARDRGGGVGVADEAGEPGDRRVGVLEHLAEQFIRELEGRAEGVGAADGGAVAADGPLADPQEPGGVGDGEAVEQQRRHAPLPGDGGGGERELAGVDPLGDVGDGEVLEHRLEDRGADRARRGGDRCGGRCSGREGVDVPVGVVGHVGGHVGVCGRGRGLGNGALGNDTRGSAPGESVPGRSALAWSASGHGVGKQHGRGGGGHGGSPG